MEGGGNLLGVLSLPAGFRGFRRAGAISCCAQYLWYEAIVAFETGMVHGQPLPQVNDEPLYYLNTHSPWLQKPAFLQTTVLHLGSFCRV